MKYREKAKEFGEKYKDSDLIKEVKERVEKLLPKK